MIKEIILYKDTKVFFSETQYVNVDKTWEEQCALCRKKLGKGDKLYLIMNDYILFPNLYVHRACAPSKEECVEQLVKSYKEFGKEFEDIKKKYKFWFDKTHI